MKCMKVGQLKHTGRVALLVASVFASSVAAAANYWKGVDGADLADAANWSGNVIPTTAAGTFNARSEHGSDYTARLSDDQSFYQFIWDEASNLNTVFNLGGNTLTFSGGSNIAAMRLNADYSGIEATLTNGVVNASSYRCGVWVLGNNQTMVLGEGLTFNGDLALHNNAARSGSKIVVKDGAKVNGFIYVDSKISDGEILVSGEGTEVNFGGKTIDLSGGDTFGDNTFRVTDGAIATNVAVSLGTANCTNLAIMVDGGRLYATSFSTGIYGVSNSVTAVNGSELFVADNVNVGYHSSVTPNAKGTRIVVDSGSHLYTANWDTSTDAKNVNLGRLAGGDNEIFVGDGGAITTRQFIVRGTGNTLSISNGTVSAVVFTIAGGNTLRFFGNSPKLHERESKTLTVEAGSTFSFDLSAAGYASAPVDLYPNSDFTMPDDTILEVNAKAFAGNGGGTVPLMTFRGKKEITFSETLLSRWNRELASKNCSVSYDSSARTLYLTVKKPGLAIFVR